MDIDATRTVREFAAEIPNATRIFEKFGIDYCCGGSKALETACRQANVPLEEVLRSLEGASSPASAPAASPDFSNISLTDLVAHILTTHHIYSM
jgi:regulator of cell morphogenesis and NO signaling